MGEGQTPLESQLLSFSIVLETENLANADIEGLSKSLASLAHQNLSPACAHEVFLIDSGDTPVSLLEQLCERYPWIKVIRTSPDTGYYKAKMQGAELATGKIVVYFDSDCIYAPNWLRTLLQTFTEDESIQIVAGETMTRGLGIYGTAMALAYIFPPFSGEQNLTKTSQYYLNNVAFRRDFLLQYPIPSDLPLYRGNCAIHAYNLRSSGYTIWKQPQAKATHAPPSSLSHFFWRFLLIGHDYYWQKRILANVKKLPVQGQDSDPMTGIKGKFKVLDERVGRLIRSEPRHLIYLPFAALIALLSSALVAIGYFITAFKPNYLLKTYSQILGED